MIKIENVTKTFGDFTAVDAVNLEIGKGEVFGFIGPNGAGKTTTIKMLATLSLPTEGPLSVGGFDIVRQPREVRRIIGYMPDSFGVYDALLVWESVVYFAALVQGDPSRSAGSNVPV